MCSKKPFKLDAFCKIVVENGNFENVILIPSENYGMSPTKYLVTVL